LCGRFNAKDKKFQWYFNQKEKIQMGSFNSQNKGCKMLQIYGYWYHIVNNFSYFSASFILEKLEKSCIQRCPSVRFSIRIFLIFTPQSLHGGRGGSDFEVKIIISFLNIYPVLFITGLSCPSCMQASLPLDCLNLTKPGFPHNCLPVSLGDISLRKNPMPTIGLEIRPQNACSAFRVLLPSENYSAE
jgi:hypothetical protein